MPVNTMLIIEALLNDVQVRVWCAVSAVTVTGAIFLCDLKFRPIFYTYFNIIFKRLSEYEPVYFLAKWCNSSRC